MKRILRFCIGYPIVLCFGTYRFLDPEGRSVRLGPIAAARYMWQVAQ